MNRVAQAVMTLAFLLFTASSVLAAGYTKMGDIKGESKDTKHAPSPKVKDKTKTENTGLLVPAVQKVRSSAKDDSKSKKKGNAETTWKVEKGEK